MDLATAGQVLLHLAADALFLAGCFVAVIELTRPEVVCNFL